MGETIETDICVIGAGSGGLSVAAGAVQMGARVVLVERGAMGGDCLNYGCVPSKSLIAAAKGARAGANASRFGIGYTVPEIDMAAVAAHIEGVIEGIAPHDSVERFENLGVIVLRESAHFAGPNIVLAGERRVEAKRIVIATGSSPLVPPIPGIDTVPYLTNETVFSLTSVPSHLLVIGGGPIGLELASAFRALGAEVTVVEAAKLLAKDDPELVSVVTDRLASDGIRLIEGKSVESVARDGEDILLNAGTAGDAETIRGSHLLVAAGRRPNVADLNLDNAGIKLDGQAIRVDQRLRTSNRRVFAIGDVSGPYQFTHMAGYHAGIVIRNALFRLPSKVDYRAVPWVTYTEPELAQVGLTEAEARRRHGEVTVLRAPFRENDRARTERDEDGLVKVVVGRRGRILGAGIVGKGAGDQIGLWALAIQEKRKIGTIAGLILPYPTRSEASKRAAGSYFTPALFSERTRRLVRFLLRFV